MPLLPMRWYHCVMRDTLSNGPARVIRFLRLLGIRVTDLTREDAAAELYGFDVTVRWRPLILLPPEDRPQ